MFDTHFVLIRFFSCESHVECFRSGKIRMMNSKYYKENYKNDHIKQVKGIDELLYNSRYDCFENSIFVYNPDEQGVIIPTVPIRMGETEYNKITVNPNISCSPILISDQKLDEKTKICCLYSLIRESIINNKLISCIDERVGNFGSYFCLITNTDEFLRRVTKAMSEH